MAEHDLQSGTGADAGTETAEGVAGRASSPAMDELPPYRVLLHNDDDNDMFYVIETLVELTPLSKPVATRAMLQAHMHGAAAIVTTHKERAELYRDQLQSRYLTASIEPVEG